MAAAAEGFEKRLLQEVEFALEDRGERPVVQGVRVEVSKPGPRKDDGDDEDEIVRRHFLVTSGHIDDAVITPDQEDGSDDDVLCAIDRGSADSGYAEIVRADGMLGRLHVTTNWQRDDGYPTEEPWTLTDRRPTVVAYTWSFRIPVVGKDMFVLGFMATGAIHGFGFDDFAEKDATFKRIASRAPCWDADDEKGLVESRQAFRKARGDAARVKWLRDDLVSPGSVVSFVCVPVAGKAWVPTSEAVGVEDIAAMHLPVRGDGPWYRVDDIPAEVAPQNVVHGFINGTHQKTWLVGAGGARGIFVGVHPALHLHLAATHEVAWSKRKYGMCKEVSGAGEVPHAGCGAAPAGRIRHDGKPDMRYKANREALGLPPSKGR